MSNELKHLMNGNATFHQRQEPLSKSEKDKVKSLSADIETSTNKKLVVRCLLVAAALMLFLQSGQLVSTVEKLSPNLLSDSAKVISKEWHKGMEAVGASDLRGKITKQVQNVLSQFNPRSERKKIELKERDGGVLSLRGAIKINPDSAALSQKDYSPKALTSFGAYKFRGSI